MKKILLGIALTAISLLSVHAQQTTTWAVTSGSGTGYSWSGTTLTLTNFTWNTSAETAMSLPGGTTIVLNGTNSITSTFEGVASTYGIKVADNGTLTISEGTNGSLSATGGTSTNASSFGIYTFRGGITINGGAITAKSGNANASSMGIYISSYNGEPNAYNLVMKGGSLHTIASESSEANSYGICTANSSTIIIENDNIQIIAESSNASRTSAALYIGATPSGICAIGGEDSSSTNVLNYDSTIKAFGYTVEGSFTPAAYAVTSKGTNTGINDANADSPIISTEYFDITGKKLTGKPAKGFYIENNFHENGTRSSRTMGAF